MVTDFGILVVQVMEDAIRMGSRNIEPRVGCGSAVRRRVPVEFCERAGSGEVVIDDIDDDCYPGRVAFVDEGLVRFTRSVRLVEGKI